MTNKNPPATQNADAKRTNGENDEETEEEEPPLKKQFMTFVTYKDRDNPGTHILLSQSDFWMKQAGVIAGRVITPTDTGNLADYKNVPVDEIIEKMVNCQPPPPEISLVKPLIK